jgi:Uma2 family endonuclease
MTHAIGLPRRPPSSLELVCDDGEPMESARHRQQMVLLIESLQYALQERTDFYVGGNMFLYFSETQARHNDFRGPDVFVVLDTTRRERRAWVTWEENGKTPDVIIELLSESTERIDRGEKMRLYGRALKVGEYFLFDPFSGVLEGYELAAPNTDYVKKQADAEGRYACRQLGLLLGKVQGTLWSVDAHWLRWLQPDGGVLPMPSEEALRLASMVGAEAERANAEAERANAEAERANAEAERANAEAERANAEAERANRLAAELEALKSRR